MAEMYTLILEDAEETRRLGASLARVIRPADVIALSGDLGAGKTTLAQGLARALGAEEDVISPTFALMSEYHTRPPLLHVDAYRLESDEDAAELGLDEYLDDGWAMVVEWPENIAGALPEDLLTVHLEHDGERRTAALSAFGPVSAARLKEWNLARTRD
jgi:tRNA threonylcarbamoyladenosine biosynthesis protein TsaE